MSRLTRLIVIGALTATSVVALSAFLSPTRSARAVQPSEVIVRIDSVGTRGFREGATVRIYADGAARIAVGTRALTALTDTLQLRGLPAFSVDVAHSDVHVELVRGDAADQASFYIGGSVTGGRATRLAASGRHLLLLKGGMGVRVLAPATARQVPRFNVR